MRRFTFIFLVAVTMSSVTFGTLEAQEWGAQTITSVGDIFTGGGQRNSSFSASGGAGIPIAESIHDDSVELDFFGDGPWDRGLARAFTGLPFTRNVIAPMRAQSILTGNLSSQPFLGSLPSGATATASAFVSDQFQYIGTQATTLSLTWNLEGRVDDPVGIGSDVANGLTQIRAAAAVFADTPQYRFLGDVPTLVAENGAVLKQANGVDAVDLFQTLLIEDDTSGLIEQRTLTLDFEVTPGETFYVWQELRTSAAFGTRQADAFGTMTGTFSQPSLVQRIGAIPEPSGTLILSLAILGLGARRIRRSTLQAT